MTPKVSMRTIDRMTTAARHTTLLLLCALSLMFFFACGPTALDLDKYRPGDILTIDLGNEGPVEFEVIETPEEVMKQLQSDRLGNVPKIQLRNGQKVEVTKFAYDGRKAFVIARVASGEHAGIECWIYERYLRR